MPKILVVSDDEKITVEIVEIPDPTDDEEPLYAARCRNCSWHSFLTEDSARAARVYESDAINDAQTHIDTHERVS